MFGISSFEFFVIIFFAFLVFGPDKLPEIGRILGRAIKQFREASETMSKTIQTEVTDPFQEAIQPYQETIQETVAPLQEDIQAINQTMRETEDAIKEPFKELANPMGTDSYDKAGRKRGKYGRTSKHTSHNVREGTKPSLFGAQKSDKQKAKEAGTVDFGHVRTEEDNIAGRREDDLLSDANLKKANERVKAREESEGSDGGASGGGGAASEGDGGSRGGEGGGTGGGDGGRGGGGVRSTSSSHTNNTNGNTKDGTQARGTGAAVKAGNAEGSSGTPAGTTSPSDAAPAAGSSVAPSKSPASDAEPATPAPSALAASLYGLGEDDEVPSTKSSPLGGSSTAGSKRGSKGGSGNAASANGGSPKPASSTGSGSSAASTPKPNSSAKGGE